MSGPLQPGDRLNIQYGEVTATGRFLTLTSNPGKRANVFVRLDGTDELVSVPHDWVQRVEVPR